MLEDVFPLTLILLSCWIGMSMMLMREGMSSFAFIPIFVTVVLVTGVISWCSVYLLLGGRHFAFEGGVLSFVSSVLGGLAMRSLPLGRLGRSFVISKTIAIDVSVCRGGCLLSGCHAIAAKP